MIYTNERTGQYRDVPTGFSFTTLFFGPFPMLFRGETGYFFLQLILSIVTMGISHIFFAFAINGMCERKLQQDGFKPEIKYVDAAKSDGDIEQMAVLAKGGPSITTLVIVSALVFVFVLPSIFTTGSNNQNRNQEIAQIETPTEAPTTSIPKVIPEVPQEVITAPISDIPLPDHKPMI